MSASLPWSGGIIAPPNIIITKKEDPWEVYFPRPVILSEKMQGHIIEQNNPPVKNAKSAIFPEPKIPINMAIIPRELNIVMIFTALSLDR